TKSLQRLYGLIRSNSDESRKPVSSDRSSSNGSQEGGCRFEPQIIVHQRLQKFVIRFIYYQAKHRINGSFPVSDKRRKKGGACLPDLTSHRKRRQAMDGYLVQDFSGRGGPAQ